MADVIPSVDADAKMPRTRRGRETRAKLILAARAIFEADGFPDARITDIAKEAGVAYGSFYTYFPTKEAIFREVARAMQQEMISDRHEASEGASDDTSDDAVHPAGDGVEASPRSRRLYDRVERANRLYLESYARNARLMAVLEQVALFNEELFAIRREMRRAFVDRSTAAIDRWQRAGLVDPELDPRYAASALGSMVDRFAYVWFVLDGDFEIDAAVANLTRLWIQALGMSVDTELPST